MTQIYHWQTYFGTLDPRQGHPVRTLEVHAQKSPNGMLDHSGPGDHNAKAEPVVARVSGSCWIADCPTGDGGAEFVNFDDLRFFCCTCRNADWGGETLPVRVPDPAERLKAEEVLVKRPDPDTRNWTPGEEDVADLKVENLAHVMKP